MMKKFMLGGFALLAIQQANAQLTSAAPYCAPEFRQQYNMLNNIKIKGTTFSFSAMGGFGKKDPFLYYNSTTFPSKGNIIEKRS